MMKLYLDDVRPIPAGWVGVDNVDAAKKLLLSGDVVELSLDNDLGAGCKNNCWKEVIEGQNTILRRDCGSTCPDSCHAVGLDLVKWMVETDNWSKNKPTVHSANPVAAPYMKELVEKYWTNKE
jgi:hypothetical protein